MKTEKKLVLMVGLPQSGKSTAAREMGFPIVCPNEIRKALHGKEYIQSSEPFVWAVAHLMVDALFLSGHDTVILDACNVTKKRRGEWDSDKYRSVCVKIESGLPLEGLKERAIKNGKPELVPVIDRMFAAFEPLERKET